MPPVPHAESFAELELHRLDRDWTFDQLAAAMKRAGFKIPMRTLHYLLKQAPKNVRPRDRTMHKINRYLEHVRENDRRRRARAARRSVTNKAAAATPASA